MINASVAIQVLPKVTDDEKLVAIVDEVIAYIKSKGLKTFVSPFETTIEGDYEVLMEIIKECQYIAVKAGAPGLMSFIKIDFNADSEILSIDKKTSKYHNN